MHNLAHHRTLSPVSLCVGTAATLFVAYIGLIAVVMTYAAVTIEFTQSVKNDEAAVASLESRYLDAVASVTGSDYAALGYTKPATEIFVPSAPATALR